MGKSSRKKRRHLPAATAESLSGSALGKAPPRKVVRITPGRPFITRSDALIYTFSFAFAAMVIAGPAFLRLAAIGFGQETTAVPLALANQKTLKGRTWTVLAVRFTTAEGQLVRKDFPVGLGSAAAFTREHPSFGEVKVAYLPAVPWVSGLVDDFSYTRTMLTLIGATFSGLLLLAAGVHLYLRYIIESRRQQLLSHGIALPFETKGSFLSSTRISYQYEGKTYRARVTAARIWFAVKFKEGSAVVIDPERPKKFLIYGDGPFRVER
jgi:hypothetical protein